MSGPGRRMDNQKKAIWFVSSSYLWLAASVLIAGALYPNYSHVSQFVSVLGATGAPHGNLVNFVGFFGAEILFIVGLAFAAIKLSKNKLNLVGFTFLFCYPLLILVAACAPCDAYCQPDEPSVSHTIHMTSALLGYLCAIVGLFLLSRQSGSKVPSRVLQLASYIIAPLLIVAIGSMTPDNSAVGAIQRISETSLYAWTIWWIMSLAQKHSS